MKENGKKDVQKADSTGDGEKKIKESVFSFAPVNAKGTKEYPGGGQKKAALSEVLTGKGLKRTATGLLRKEEKTKLHCRQKRGVATRKRIII